MTARTDIETIASDIETVLKTYLNTRLASINAEKNDGLECLDVADAAYFFQDLNDDLTNYDPFILYGVNAIVPQSDYGRCSQDITYSVTVILADNAQDGLSKIMLRYGRALKEIFEENWYLVNNGIKLKVNSLTPVDLEGLNTSTRYKAIGITLEANIG